MGVALSRRLILASIAIGLAIVYLNPPALPADTTTVYSLGYYIGQLLGAWLLYAAQTLALLAILAFLYQTARRVVRERHEAADLDREAEAD